MSDTAKKPFKRSAPNQTEEEKLDAAVKMQPMVEEASKENLRLNMVTEKPQETWDNISSVDLRIGGLPNQFVNKYFTTNIDLTAATKVLHLEYKVSMCPQMLINAVGTVYEITNVASETGQTVRVQRRPEKEANKLNKPKVVIWTP
jgi:hypothetical protein